MKAAPYNPDTLKRIRAGASARDLGWGDAMFISICRKHEIPIIVAKPVSETVKPAEVEKRAVEPPAMHQGPGATVIFDKKKRELTRSQVIINLTIRQARMIEVLAVSPLGAFVSGGELSDAADAPRDQMGGYAISLRQHLRKLSLDLEGRRGKYVGGYRVVDGRSREPVTVYVAHDEAARP